LLTTILQQPYDLLRDGGGGSLLGRDDEVGRLPVEGVAHGHQLPELLQGVLRLQQGPVAIVARPPVLLLG
jgi:hypothetical protein